MRRSSLPQNVKRIGLAPITVVHRTYELTMEPSAVEDVLLQRRFRPFSRAESCSPEDDEWMTC